MRIKTQHHRWGLVHEAQCGGQQAEAVDACALAVSIVVAWIVGFWPAASMSVCASTLCTLQLNDLTMSLLLASLQERVRPDGLGQVLLVFDGPDQRRRLHSDTERRPPPPNTDLR